MDTIIERAFLYEIISTAIIGAMIIALLIFIRWGLKDNKHFKLIFLISIAIISFAVVTIMAISLSKIVLDIQNKDYIIYHGEYIERGDDLQDNLKTVVVYDDQGNEIKLLRTGPSKKGGVYEGTVIYGKRSKIIVEYSGSLKYN